MEDIPSFFDAPPNEESGFSIGILFFTFFWPWKSSQAPKGPFPPLGGGVETGPWFLIFGALRAPSTGGSYFFRRFAAFSTQYWVVLIIKFPL